MRAAESVTLQPVLLISSRSYTFNAIALGVSPTDISGPAFELVVAAWLADLVRSEEQREKLTDGQSWLVESGFLTAVRDGRVAYEEAA